MAIIKIREFIQKPIVKNTFIGFIFLAFIGTAVFSLGYSLLFGDKNDYAWVNGKGISRKLFYDQTKKQKEVIDNLYRRYGQQAELIMNMYGMDSNPEEAAKKFLIQKELFNQAIDAFPVYVSQEFIQTRLQDPYFLYQKKKHLMPSNILNSQGRIDHAVFQQFLATQDSAALEKELEDDIQASIAQSLITGAAYVPEFLIKEGYALQNTGKKFSIATYSLDKFLKEEQEKEISEKEVTEYYEKNKKQYYTAARRSGTKWVFEASDFDITISEKEIKDFYNKVKFSRFIEAPAQVKVKKIAFTNLKEKGLVQLKEEATKVREEALKKDSDFSALAKKHSTDASAKNGGVINFFKRGTHDKVFEQASFRLKKDNDISPLIETKEGYFFVQRVARKEATFKSLESVKKEIISILTNKKFATEFSRKAYNITRIKGDNATEQFDAFIKKNNGKVEIVNPLAKGENATAEKLFSLKRSGDKLAYIAEGKGIILELKDVIKAVLPPVDMLSSYIKKDIQKERAYKALANHLKDEKAKAIKNNKLTAGAYGKVKTTGYLKASDQKEYQKLAEEGLPREIASLSKKGTVVVHGASDKGFLIMLDDLEKVDTKKYNDKHNELKISLLNQYKEILMGSFIASLYKNAKIEVNITPNSARKSYEI